MNALLKNYTFNASAKTITLTDLAAGDVKAVRFIKNLTTNTIIYSLTDALTISIVGNVITFTGSNAGMNNTDVLSIQYFLDTSFDVQKVSLPSSLIGQLVASSSLPVTLSLETASGTITAQNLNPASGTATTNSTVELLVGDSNSVSIQVSTALTGSLTYQYTTDGVNWISNAANCLRNNNNGALNSTISSGFTGIYMAPTYGAYKVRVSANGATSGSATVTLRGSHVTGITSVDSINTVVVQGTANHSATTSGAPVFVGGKVVPLTVATIDILQAAGDAGGLPLTPEQQLVIKNLSPAALDFNAIGGLTNTVTPNIFKAASSASTRNFISHITISSGVLGGATELAIRDAPITFTSQTIASNTLTSSQVHDLKPGDEFVATAATNITGLTVGTVYYVLTTPSTTTLTLSTTPFGSTLTITGTGVTMTANKIIFKIGLAGAVNNISIPLITPLRGAVNGTFDVLTTTAVTGTVYYNIQGFTAAQ